MTITHHASAALLFFSSAELAPLSPQDLTREQVLDLVHRALSEAKAPMPPTLEVHTYPSDRGLLLFLWPVPFSAAAGLGGNFPLLS
jgi:hypothetical protein